MPGVEPLLTSHTSESKWDHADTVHPPVRNGICLPPVRSNCRPSMLAGTTQSANPLARRPRGSPGPRGGAGPGRTCLDLKNHYLQLQDQHTDPIRVLGVDDKTCVSRVRPRPVTKPADDRHPAVGLLVVDQHLPAEIVIKIDFVPRLRYCATSDKGPVSQDFLEPAGPQYASRANIPDKTDRENSSRLASKLFLNRLPGRRKARLI